MLLDRLKSLTCFTNPPSFISSGSTYICNSRLCIATTASFGTIVDLYIRTPPFCKSPHISVYICIFTTVYGSIFLLSFLFKPSRVGARCTCTCTQESRFISLAICSNILSGTSNTAPSASIPPSSTAKPPACQHTRSQYVHHVLDLRIANLRSCYWNHRIIHIIGCMFHPPNPIGGRMLFMRVLDRSICAAASPYKRLQASLRSQIPL